MRKNDLAEHVEILAGTGRQDPARQRSRLPVLVGKLKKSIKVLFGFPLIAASSREVGKINSTAGSIDKLTARIFEGGMHASKIKNLAPRSCD